jgi:hypothetical protein
MIDINLNGKKITNYVGKKIMVQALQFFGQDTASIRY